jgi:hypothetical protein
VALGRCFFLGKPLLEVFNTWHRYTEDVILLRGDDGETVWVTNEHAGA